MARLRARRALRSVLAAAAALLLCASAAALEVNTASEADLDGVRGIGPGLSARILGERSRAPFTGWGDFIARVGGVGPASAARLAREGLTVNGQAYGAPAPARPGSAPAAAAPPAAAAAGRD